MTSKIHNALEQKCLSEMSQNGIPYSGSIDVDGKIHRFSCDAKKNKKDEWYVAFKGNSRNGNEYLACTYGSWNSSLTSDRKYTFKSWENDSAFDSDEREQLHVQFNQKKEAIAREQQESKDVAAHEACRVWNVYESTQASEAHLRYCFLKKIKATGVRFGNSPHGYPCMIIPIQNVNGDVRSLQFISVDDDNVVYKTFLKDGEKNGNYFVFGKLINNSPIFVSEGYATACSIFEAYDEACAVVVAFDCHNLSSVVANLHKAYPNSLITICGDDDVRTTGNPGRTKAEEVAQKYQCNAAFPKFPDGKQNDRNGKFYTDFNDLMLVAGKEEVKKQLETLKESDYTIKKDFLKVSNPCAGFSTKSLPKDLDSYIASKCETTQADPIMLTMATLGMLSGFVQKKCSILEGEYFQTLYPNLWMLAITKSGGFKTTALNKGISLAFKRLEDVRNRVEELNAKELKENKNQVSEIEKENILLPNRATAEGLIEHLSSGFNGLITASEFGEWLENLDKQHNGGLKALLTDLYDVPQIYTYKTRTQGFLTVEKPFISICGVSTLDWVKKNLKPEDVSSGFFARFLLFAPPYKEEIPPARPQPCKSYDKEAETRIWNTLNNIGPIQYSLTPETGKLFDTLHESIYKKVYGYSERSKDILSPYLKRWSPYLLKLAMLLRVIEDPLSNEISDTALAGAMAILDPAINSTAHLFEKDLGESLTQRKCRKIKDYIAKKGGIVSRRNLIKAKVLEGSSKEYDEILNTLIESGEVLVLNDGERKYVLKQNDAD